MGGDACLLIKEFRGGGGSMQILACLLAKTKSRTFHALSELSS